MNRKDFNDAFACQAVVVQVSFQNKSLLFRKIISILVCKCPDDTTSLRVTLVTKREEITTIAFEKK
jgi:hypothetical protein